MAYDEQMIERVLELIVQRTENVTEKKMFGGLCFMVEDKICVGVKKDTILVRIDPDVYDKEIENPGRKPMMNSGRAIKPYLFVDFEEIRSAKDLAYWVNLALDFNPHAPLSQAKQKAKKSQVSK